MPHERSGEGIDGEDLIGAGDVEDSIGGQGRGFEAEVGDGEDPLHFERGDVRGVDLFEGAVAIGGEVAVVGDPVAGLGRGEGGLSSCVGDGGGSDDGFDVEVV